MRSPSELIQVIEIARHRRTWLSSSHNKTTSTSFAPSFSLVSATLNRCSIALLLFFPLPVLLVGNDAHIAPCSPLLLAADEGGARKRVPEAEGSREEGLLESAGGGGQLGWGVENAERG